jgi:hypothetical protein
MLVRKGFVLMVNKGATVAIELFINAKNWWCVASMPRWLVELSVTAGHICPCGPKIADTARHVSTMKAPPP